MAGFINYLQIEPTTASDTSTMLQPWTVGLLDDCELGGSSCDSSIICQCVDLDHPVASFQTCFTEEKSLYEFVYEIDSST